MKHTRVRTINFLIIVTAIVLFVWAITIFNIPVPQTGAVTGTVDIQVGLPPPPPPPPPPAPPSAGGGALGPPIGIGVAPPLPTIGVDVERVFEAGEDMALIFNVTNYRSTSIDLIAFVTITKDEEILFQKNILSEI